MNLDKGMEPPDAQSDNDVENILGWVARCYLPEDIFTYGQLEFWATSHGFILPDNNTQTKDY